jgi:hypothetical protein
MRYYLEERSRAAIDNYTKIQPYATKANYGALVAWQNQGTDEFELVDA